MKIFTYLKKYVLIIIVVIIISFNSYNASLIHKKPTYKYLKSVTVFISRKTIPNNKHFLYTKKKKKWRGTGVIVKIDKTNTYILTNKHVVGGYASKPSETFIIEGKKSIKCEIIKMHSTQDLALLKIKDRLRGKQSINGLAFPNITEKVYTVGHSLGRPYIYGEGIFSGTILRHDVYQLPCISGQSGSGIFNKHGYLLGLIYSGSGTIIKGVRVWDFTRANVVKGVYLKEFLEELY